MKIIAINRGDTGSSGSLAKSILKNAQDNGDEVILACAFPSTSDIKTKRISHSRFLNKVSGLLSRIFGNDGFGNIFSTLIFLKWLKNEKPDVIHIHTLHGHYINVEMLFNFIVRNKIKTIMTLHDCWAFTAKCPYYLHINCSAWKCNKCNTKCPHQKDYPSSYFKNNMHSLLERKNNLYHKAKEYLTLVSVSNWLDKEVAQSCVSDIKHVCIQNNIAIRKYQFKRIKRTKPIIFSAAYPWNKTKNLNSIIRFANLYKDFYTFYIAGLEKTLDNKSIISLGKLNKEQMFYYYYQSDVFLNLSFEESFGLTNIEAQSQGTPVICSINSGGTSDTFINNKTGYFVDPNDNLDIHNAIEKCLINKIQIEKDCKEFAKTFSSNQMNESYYKLYHL